MIFIKFKQPTTHWQVVFIFVFIFIYISIYTYIWIYIDTFVYSLTEFIFLGINAVFLPMLQ